MATRIIDLVNLLAWVVIYGTLATLIIQRVWSLIDLTIARMKFGDVGGNLSYWRWVHGSLAWAIMVAGIPIGFSLGWLYISGAWTP